MQEIKHVYVHTVTGPITFVSENMWLRILLAAKNSGKLDPIDLDVVDELWNLKTK